MGIAWCGRCALETVRIGGIMQKLLRHIVLFSYKDDVQPSQKAEVIRRFRELQGRTGLIHDFECGRNNSPEGLNRGFEDGFVATFLSEADRAAYLPHPAHQEFVTFLSPFVREALVFDYWT
jgi:Stress responsive A/B Barrel Domain